MEDQKALTTLEYILQPSILGFCLLALVGLDYVQAIYLYDAHQPHLTSLISLRYFAIYLFLTHAVQNELKDCLIYGSALLLADALFFSVQSQWIIHSTDWIYVSLPFYTNLSLSLMALCVACIWVYSSWMSIALESAVYLCAFAAGLLHTVYESIVDRWLELLMLWLPSLDMQSTQIQSLAEKMAGSMTASVVNGFILIPLLFVCVMVLFLQSDKKPFDTLYRYQWLSFRMTWITFALSVTLYFLGLTLFVLKLDLHVIPFLRLGALSNLFDIVQLIPCIAGLSVLHACVEHRYKQKRFMRMFWFLTTFGLFYAFHQVFVVIGLLDKVFDARKRLNLKYLCS